MPRRNVLRRSVLAAGGSGVLAGLAGCTNLPGVEGRSTADLEIESTDAQIVSEGARITVGVSSADGQSYARGTVHVTVTVDGGETYTAERDVDVEGTQLIEVFLTVEIPDADSLSRDDFSYSTEVR